MAFSPDGRRLVTGSWDHTVRIWDADTLKPAVRLEYRANVFATDFSPDGKLLATCSRDGKVVVMRYRPEDLMAEACARLTQNLTREE
jgi:WD40 repeat protein